MIDPTFLSNSERKRKQSSSEISCPQYIKALRAKKNIKRDDTVARLPSQHTTRVFAHLFTSSNAIAITVIYVGRHNLPRLWSTGIKYAASQICEFAIRLKKGCRHATRRNLLYQVIRYWCHMSQFFRLQERMPNQYLEDWSASFSSRELVFSGHLHSVRDNWSPAPLRIHTEIQKNRKQKRKEEGWFLSANQKKKTLQCETQYSISISLQFWPSIIYLWQSKNLNLSSKIGKLNDRILTSLPKKLTQNHEKMYPNEAIYRHFEAHAIYLASTIKAVVMFISQFGQYLAQILRGNFIILILVYGDRTDDIHSKTKTV